MEVQGVGPKTAESLLKEAKKLIRTRKKLVEEKKEEARIHALEMESMEQEMRTDATGPEGFAEDTAEDDGDAD
jgi:hypothetical protein